MAVRRYIVRESKSTRTAGKTIGAVIGAAVSLLYLLNLSAGMIEIPDNLPIVGNLDEAAVSGFFYGCMSYLGINLVPFQRKK